MKVKKQLKQLKKFIHDELIQAKATYNNGCSPYDSIAKAKYEALKLIAKKAINLKNSGQINTFG